MNQCISHLLNQSFIYTCKCDTVGDGDSESTQTIILFMTRQTTKKECQWADHTLWTSLWLHISNAESLHCKYLMPFCDEVARNCVIQKLWYRLLSWCHPLNNKQTISHNKKHLIRYMMHWRVYVNVWMPAESQLIGRLSTSVLTQTGCDLRRNFERK